MCKFSAKIDCGFGLLKSYANTAALYLLATGLPTAGWAVLLKSSILAYSFPSFAIRRKLSLICYFIVLGTAFILQYAYRGYLSDVKEQIVDMAMNGSGIRDTARVLKISPTTVLIGIKKRPSAGAGE